MGGRSLLGLLAYEAKIKPKVKLLVDQVDSLTDDDIAKAEVPLPWVRVALKMLRDKKLEEIKQAEILRRIVDGKNPDINGVVGIWVSDDTYIRAQGTMEISIKHNDIVFFGDDGSMWLAYTKCERLSEENFQMRDRMTRTEYLNIYRQILSSKV